MSENIEIQEIERQPDGRTQALEIVPAVPDRNESQMSPEDERGQERGAGDRTLFPDEIAELASF